MDVVSYLLGKKAGGGGSSDLDWSAIGYSGTPQVITDGYNYAIDIKDNWESKTNYSYMFNNNMNLIYMPLVDTSAGTNFNSMFTSCSSLQTVPLLNVSAGTDFRNMFSGCEALKEVPNLDTSLGTKFTSMFSNCKSLKTVGELDFSSANTLDGFMGRCNSLENCGGFKNVGQAYLTTQSANYYPYGIGLSECTKLTHDSLMNIINKLYDIQAKGCNTQSIWLDSQSISKLTAEEIAIATNKGWTIET